ncbi:MAG: low molecular weight phosphotyrosine protein phosphatase [Clostridia bacterium]|nr:low molecular weight phosphotyrosine protein phosphatase [Clostridia bacterium]
MIKVMFVCHGNICRSPMAEFLFKELVKKEGKEKEFSIKSSATTSEELGNPVHYGTRAVLNRLNISCSGKYAEKLQASDYNNYDYFIGMDEKNRSNMLRIFGGDKGGKIKLLLDFTGEFRDVADPWWTGDFEATYKDVSNGIKALYEFLTK